MQGVSHSAAGQPPPHLPKCCSVFRSAFAFALNAPLSGRCSSRCPASLASRFLSRTSSVSEDSHGRLRDVYLYISKLQKLLEQKAASFMIKIKKDTNSFMYKEGK